MSTTPAPANRFRERLPVVLGAAAIFLVLLVVTGITENNWLGTVCGVYAIVAGILLGRVLVKSEPATPS
jgi:hypothetical protein